MNYNELDRLEVKITDAIHAIERLTNENQKLKMENEKLIEQIHNQEETIQKLKVQYQNFKQIEDQAVIYKERENQIRSKVQTMLEKLESFKEISSDI